MSKRKLFKITRRRVVFSKGPIHLVDCEVRMATGQVLSRQILEHPGAVVILPKLASGKFLLIRQFRFAAKDFLWEFPAGGIEPGESLKEAASRELREEAGLRPKRLKFLIRFYPTPGVSGEVMHLFLAEGLVPAIGKPDEDEEIEKREFSLPAIGKMIRAGKVCDAKTILGYFLLNQRGQTLFSKKRLTPFAVTP